MNLGGDTQSVATRLLPGQVHDTLHSGIMHYAQVNVTNRNSYTYIIIVVPACKRANWDTRDKDPFEDEFNWDYNPGWPYVSLHNIVVRISYGDKPIV